MPGFGRLLLLADLALKSRHLQDFRALNWEARAQAMFLAYKARAASPEPTIFARLRFEDKTLLKCVVLFL